MNTFSKNLKIVRLIVITVLIALGTSGLYNLLSSNAASTLESITNIPNAEEITEDTKLPEKYTFFPEIQKDTKGNQITKATPFGNWDRVNTDTVQDSTMNPLTGVANAVWIPKDDTSYDGKIGMIYDNIGKFNGKTVKLKATYMGSSEGSTNNGFGLIMYNDKLGIRTSLAPEKVHIKYEFFDSVTGEPLKVAGYQEFRDLDSNQGLKIENYDKIYYDVSAKDHFKYGTSGGAKGFIITEDATNLTSQALKTRIAYTFDSTEINFTWSSNLFFFKEINDVEVPMAKPYIGLTEEESLDRMLGVYYYVDANNNICDSTTEGAIRKIAVNTLNASSSKMVPSEIVKPVKYTSNEYGIEVNTESYQREQPIYFSIVSDVPGELSENYYTSYEIVDEVEPCFEILEDSIKVINNNTEEDFTKLFNVSVENNVLKVAAKSDWVSNSNFYAKSYKVIFAVAIAESTNLDSYLENGVYKIPNTPKLIVNTETTTGNTIEVPVKEIPELNILKNVDKFNYKIGETANYTIEVSQSVKNAIAENVIIMDKFGYVKPTDWTTFTLSKDLTDLHKYVWSDKKNVYYSNGTEQYVLKGNKWTKKEWKLNGETVEIYGDNVWKSGLATYYFDGNKQYLLEDGKLIELTSGVGNTPGNNFYGKNIWTVGSTSYYTNSDSSKGHVGQYKLVSNGYSETWEAVNLGITNLNAENVWKIHDQDFYYSDNGSNYSFNTINGKFEEKTWKGFTNLTGKYIWNDGTNVYYSNGSNQYVLNGDTWETKTWNTSPSPLNGEYVWSGDQYTAYSNNGTNYKLVENKLQIKDFKAVDKNGNSLDLEMVDNVIETGMDLSYGDKIIITYSVDLLDEDLADQTIRNTAMTEADNVSRITSSNSITVGPAKPILEITKTSNEKVYYKGEKINYEVVLTQVVDRAKAKDIQFVDTMLLSITGLELDKNSVKLFNNDNEEIDFELTGDSGNFTVKTDEVLGAGEHLTLKYTYNIPENVDLTEDTIINNKIVATSSNADAVEKYYNVSIIEPNLRITKEANDEIYGNTDVINYEVKVNQTEYNAVAKNVVIKDVLDKNVAKNISNVQVYLLENGQEVLLTDVEIVKNDGDFTIKTKHNLTSEQQLLIKYDLPISNTDLEGQKLKNTVTANADNATSVSDTVEVEILQPELFISKKSEKTTYGNGETVKYTVQVINNAERTVFEDLVINDTFDQNGMINGIQNVNVSLYEEGETTDVSDYEFETVGDNGFRIIVDDAIKLDTSKTLIITYELDLSIVSSLNNDKLVNTVKASASNVDEDKEATNTINILKPIITVEKNSNDYGFYKGDTVKYSVDISQTVKGALAKGIKITDTISNELDIIDSTIKMFKGNSEVECSFSFENDSLVVTTPETLTSDETLTLKYEYKIPTDIDLSNGKIINNKVVVETDNTTPVEDSKDIEILTPELKVEKTADKEKYGNLETVKYTITVEQTGENAEAKNIKLNDVLDKEIVNNITGMNVSVDEKSIEDFELVKDKNNFTLNTGYDLKAGEKLVITYNLPLEDLGLEGQKVNNTVTVSADNTDSKEATEVIEVLKPKLDIKKKTDKETYGNLETIKYTINVKQTVDNSESRNVVIYDELDNKINGKIENINVSLTKDGVDFTLDNAELKTENNKFTLKTKHDLRVGEEITITYEVALKGLGLEGQRILNNAGVTADDGEFVLTNTIVSIAKPRLEVNKTTNKVTYGNTDVIKYTIKAKQTVDNSEAINVVLNDVLDKEIVNSITGMKVSVGEKSIEDFELVKDKDNFNLKTKYNLKIGEELVITYDLPLKGLGLEGKTIKNIANLTADNADPVSDDVTVNVIEPKLEVNKSTDKESYGNSEVVKYKISVKQTVEDVVAENIVVKDILDKEVSKNITNMKVSVIKGENSTPIKDFELVKDKDNFNLKTKYNLKAGEELVVTYELPLKGLGIENQDLKNVVTITSDNAKSVSDTATISISKPVLSIEKSADKENYTNLETVKYVLKVKQLTKNAEAENVVIVDTLDKDIVNTIKNVKVLVDGNSIENFELVKNKNNFTLKTDYDLKYGEELVITYDLPLKGLGLEGQNVNNIAKASADNTNEVSANDIIKVSVPKLEVVKTTDKEVYGNLETVKYTVKVKQTVDNSEARNVVLNDVLDKDIATVITDMKVSVGEKSIEDFELVKDKNNFTLNTGYNLKAGEELVITYNLPLKDLGLEGKEVNNTVSVTADNTNKVSDNAKITVSIPKLEVVKTADKEVYGNLETVKYTVKVKQTVDNSESRNVVLKDLLDKDIAGVITNMKVSVGGKSIENFKLVKDKNNFILNTNYNLKAGEELVITYNLPLKDLGLEGKEVNNTVSATADNTNKVSDNAKITVSTPKLEAVKTADKEVYGNIETAKYTIKVKQTVDNSEAKNIKLSDVLDKEVVDKITDIKVLVGNTPIENFDITKDKNTLTLETGYNLKAGEELVIKYNLPVKGLEGKTVKNTATVKSDNTTDVVTVENIKVLEPKLNVVKTTDKELYNVNETIKYNVEIIQTVENTIKKNIVISDNLSSKDFIIDENSIMLTDKTGAVPFTVEMTETGFVLTVDKDYELENGNTLIVSYSAKTINPDTEISELKNTVKVNDLPEIEKIVKLENSPKLIVEKEADKKYCKPGEIVSYKVLVKQPISNAKAKNVVVVDTLDNNDLTFVENSFKVLDKDGNEVKDFVLNIDGNTFTIETSIDLVKDESLTILYDVKMNVVNGATVTNTTIANSGEIKSNEATETVKVVSPTLVTTKTSDKQKYDIGEVAKYKVVVEQTTGNATANNIVFVDKLQKDAKVKLIKKSIRVVDKDGKDVEFKYTFKDNVLTITTTEDLNYGETLTLTYEVELKHKSLVNSKLTNTVMVKSDETSDDAECTIEVFGQPKEVVDDKKPQTGDTTSILLFAGLFILSLIGTIFVVRKLND